ncbi:hypothetical protein PR048_004623 [Dryococelus australis]|uniref:Uncharacterized protein n=1 Tax=Dryococelus australis TaxID=614101 RepID=A0ABQ9I5Z5_9NEOP|nr:hypothetical protein PR048_004623 [Dryococelus australis]
MCNSESFDFAALTNSSSEPNIAKGEGDPTTYITYNSPEPPVDPDWKVINEEIVENGNELTNMAQNHTDRNNNEDHYNYKGKLVQAKPFRDFECKCIQKCYSLVGTDIGKEEYNKFWKLGDYNSQNITSQRQFSRVYTIRTIPVCRETFTETFQIYSSRVNTALCELRSNDLLDKRGKQQDGANKTSDKKMEEIMIQI